jgi:predicted dehydrogenase
MFNIRHLFFLSILYAFSACVSAPSSVKKITGAPGEIKLMTLNPGHFHAALIQKYNNARIDTNVYVYAPAGAELESHLARINSYNHRKEDPTHWHTVAYAGSDFLEKMIAQKTGNVVVVSGNNAQKMHYISESVKAGFHVLADKPMIIHPKEFEELRRVFEQAAQKHLLVYDIMTERYEITNILQKMLAQNPELFGVLEKGTPDNPAITKESVHHFSKLVSGQPLIRPAWFFDVTQQGEGLTDVSTHLVDLVFWACFPEQVIDYQKNIQILKAKRWPTELTPAQFRQTTNLPQFPDYLKKDIVRDSLLQVYSNGETLFDVNGVVAKVSVIWNYQAPEGAGDTHYSTMRGTKANLVIRQGAAEKYRPTLYVEPVGRETPALTEQHLTQALVALETTFPGLRSEPSGKGWKIVIPEKYHVGHEAHFGQVAEKYMQYLTAGRLPDWEVPNMLAKYYVTTQAYLKSR